MAPTHPEVLLKYRPHIRVLLAFLPPHLHELVRLLNYPGRRVVIVLVRRHTIVRKRRAGLPLRLRTIWQIVRPSPRPEPLDRPLSSEWEREDELLGVRPLPARLSRMNVLPPCRWWLLVRGNVDGKVFDYEWKLFIRRAA